MSADSLDWRANDFAVEIERRADGAILMTPAAALGAYPERLTDMLEHWAAQAPERTFIAQRSAAGPWRELSYRETLGRVRALAAGLASFELSAERPLVILSGNSIEHQLFALAAMYLGVPYCPVSPAYSHAGGELAKLRFVLELLTPGAVFAFNAARFERALALARELGARVIDEASLLALAASDPALAEAPHAHVRADSIAKFLLTSGSTGHPKAVITTHRMLCSNQVMLRAALPFIVEEPPVLVDWLPWNHTFGGSHNVGMVLFNGGSFYIDDGKPVPGLFETTVRNLHEISPTIYLNVPRGFEMLSRRMEEDEGLRQRFFKRLRACFFAGAALTHHTWETMERLARATIGRGVPIISGLGATETSPSATFTTPDSARAGEIGLPPPGSRIKIAPTGDKLEMRARGPHVTPGYWRAPELSAAAFDEEGFYRFGDAVRWVDPTDPRRGLAFDGRIAEDFKLASGTWVSVGPLRASLLRALAPLATEVVIAGLNRPYLAVLVLLDVPAANAALGLASDARSLRELARDPRLASLIIERLRTHAVVQTGSAARALRAAIVSEPPTIDRGEITDKGTINQRRMLERWTDLVEALYSAAPPAQVLEVMDPNEGGTRPWH